TVRPGARTRSNTRPGPLRFLLTWVPGRSPVTAGAAVPARTIIGTARSARSARPASVGSHAPAGVSALGLHDPGQVFDLLGEFGEAVHDGLVLLLLQHLVLLPPVVVDLAFHRGHDDADDQVQDDVGGQHHVDD